MEAEALRWECFGQLLSVRDGHDRIEFTGERQNGAADAAQALTEVEVEKLAAEEMLPHVRAVCSRASAS